jgi:hypothetical protein
MSEEVVGKIYMKYCTYNIAILSHHVFTFRLDVCDTSGSITEIRVRRPKFRFRQE